MADRKISDLTALTTPATGDLIPIVDISEAAAADKNKSITVGELLRGAPDGTAAAPGIAFESDGGNGMFLGGTDILAFSTGGTQAVTIDASRRLGVGTASPQQILHTVGANTTGFVGPRIQNNNGLTGLAGIEFSSDPTYAKAAIAQVRSGLNGRGDIVIYNDSNNDAANWATTDEKLRITQAGLVGIGTSNPGNLVTVQSSASGTAPELKIQNPINSASSQGAATGLSGGRLLFGAQGVYPNAGRIEYRYNSVDASFGRGGSLVVSTIGTATNALADALTIDSSQRVGIGTTGPSYKLEIVDTDGTLGLRTTNASSTSASTILFRNRDGNSNDRDVAKIVGASNGNGGQGEIEFYTARIDTLYQRAKIDRDGRLLVGTSSHSGSQIFVVEGRTSDATSYANIGFRRGSVPTSSNPTLAAIYFTDNSENQAAVISAEFDPGTWTSGSSHPGLLKFSTTADGASSPTERMRIKGTGSVCIGTTDELPSNNNVNGAAFYRGQGLLQMSRPGDLLSINRTSTDGNLVVLRQDGTTEGSISVSGTTVSYNGAHLSRWSQLPSGAERTEILRGSVLSNIDEMCEWGEEENEQLNRMKVSDVEGDKNVAGVFQAWDDDDDTYTNDFYCAMTGDFIIRIAQGVTVERGDLLMSAGDGTAKPQDDDIIRSKTIAKVTSTNVSCTYDDGSYCVPCVLMAC